MDRAVDEEQQMHRSYAANQPAAGLRADFPGRKVVASEGAEATPATAIATDQQCNKEALLRDRRQQQALLTPFSGDPKCPLLRDVQQQELVRQHTFDDTIRLKQPSAGALSLFTRSSSDSQHPVTNSEDRWRQLSLSRTEEELFAAGLNTMEDLSPEQAARISAELRAHARKQQQQQVHISGAIKSAAPAELHPLQADAQVAAAIAPGKVPTDDHSALRELRSGHLHGETSDEEIVSAAPAANLQCRTTRQQKLAEPHQHRQQEQQQQHEHRTQQREQPDEPHHEIESEEQKCERIAASIRFQAEADLSKRREEMAALREDAERQLLSLQLLPPPQERLSSLPASLRESLFGVFVCLCLRHIEECDEDFRGEITEWALGLLNALASPNLLHLGAHIANCLSKPIAWREQLQKDGVRASDIVTMDPLIHKLEAFFVEKQAETDELFRSVQRRLKANRSDSPVEEALTDIPQSSSSSSSSSSYRDGKSSSSSVRATTHGEATSEAMHRPSAFGESTAPAKLEELQKQEQKLREPRDVPVDARDSRLRALLKPPCKLPVGVDEEHQQRKHEHGNDHAQQELDLPIRAFVAGDHTDLPLESRCCGSRHPAVESEAVPQGESDDRKQPEVRAGRAERVPDEAKNEGLHAAEVPLQGTAVAATQQRQGHWEALNCTGKQSADSPQECLQHEPLPHKEEEEEQHHYEAVRPGQQQQQDTLPHEEQEHRFQEEQLQQGRQRQKALSGRVSDSDSCTREEDRKIKPSELQLSQGDRKADAAYVGPQFKGRQEEQQQRHEHSHQLETSSSEDERDAFEGGTGPALSMWVSEPPDYRVVFLRDLTTALVTNGTFDARIQMLLDRLAAELRINPLLLIRIQENLAADLLSILQANTKEGSKQKTWRRLKIAGAAVGGGVLLALTAGLAAPGIAAAVASLGSLPLSAFLASAGGMAALVSIFGAGGAGLTGWKYSRRIANIKIFEFLMLNGRSPSSLRVGIGVSGYLRDDDDVTLPWVCSFPNPRCDLHALKWEPHVLKALGGMVIKMVSQDFAVSASKFYLQYTVLGGLTFALFWPIALIQYAAGLDNTWMLCRERAQQAGNILADAVSDKAAVGQRPVTLAGYSMGARVIFYCLQALWKKRKFHCVHDVVLMGLPASMNAAQWRQARQVTSGRLVNVYCRTDWLLAFLYRWMEFRLQVAGLAPVTSVPGVENVDVTGLVKSHANYPEKVPQIMSFISIEM
ncbi:hypothetical protein, conserved [Eimeria necatrix]|uniref:Transmembrane protein n=1 Tax=Eimeria necatrix TaxID=51315 RepID=U6MEX2_9EIME|nr:hypothetical protein, conserved [Eimeria necatrix]CDJ62551.1 hypothetical protein, conserved [Eimeria necatrix]